MIDTKYILKLRVYEELPYYEKEKEILWHQWFKYLLVFKNLTYLNVRCECLSSRDYCNINVCNPSMRYQVVNVEQT